MQSYIDRFISVDEAVSKTLSRVKGFNDLEVLELSVWEAGGYVLAEDVYASIDQPPYNRSAVDGYAVRAEDTYGASPTNPAVLKIKGELNTGDQPLIEIGSGEAVKVSTGAPMPRGADAVVMAEDTSVVDGELEVYKPVPKWANVSRMGEDYVRGDKLVSKNTLLKPQHLAIMASSGYGSVRVYRRISIGILCSGDELVEPGSVIKPGQVYNSTGVLVKNYLDEIPFIETRYYGVVGDDPGLVRDFIEKLIDRHDVLVTTGGAGISDRDVVARAVDSIGDYVFRGVAMRPGRPTSLALVNGKPLFMLSGYPVAAWTGLEALFKPIIYRLMGLEPPARPVVKALLSRRVPNVVGYRSYIRVSLAKVNYKLYAEPYMLRGSGVLSSLVKTDGYIVIPEDVEGFEKDSVVNVYLF